MALKPSTPDRAADYTITTAPKSGQYTCKPAHCVCVCVLQVVRHERASIKADIWSYGILIWELVTGEDITEYQPLSISRQVRPAVLWDTCGRSRYTPQHMLKALRKRVAGDKLPSTPCCFCVQVCPSCNANLIVLYFGTSRMAPCLIPWSHPAHVACVMCRRWAPAQMPRPWHCRHAAQLLPASCLWRAPRWTRSGGPARSSWWSGSGQTSPRAGTDQ